MSIVIAASADTTGTSTLMARMYRSGSGHHGRRASPNSYTSQPIAVPTA